MLERTVKLINKYGILKILQALCVLGAAIYLMYHVSNIPTILDAALAKRSEAVELRHDTSLEVRKEIKPTVDSILNNTLTLLNADRVFVVEMHNGTDNTAGLPFIYGEMTYEKVAAGIEHVDEDYTSLNLSRFSLPFYLEKNHTFDGTIDDLYRIDDKLAMRMKSNDVSYVAITTMQGIHNELGYFGVTYCNDNMPTDNKRLQTVLSSVSQKLAILLGKDISE